jgi:hypothetical protein
MNSGSLRDEKLKPESLRLSIFSSTKSEALSEPVPQTGQERGVLAMGDSSTCQLLTATAP